MCTHMYIYIYTYLCTHIYIYTYMCTHIYIYIHIHTIIICEAVNVSENAGIPKSSKSLDHLNIETYRDFGIHHFRNPPFIYYIVILD